MDTKYINIDHIDKAPIDLRLLDDESEKPSLKEQLIELLGEAYYKELSKPITEDELKMLSDKFNVPMPNMNPQVQQPQVGAVAESVELQEVGFADLYKSVSDPSVKVGDTVTWRAGGSPYGQCGKVVSVQGDKVEVFTGCGCNKIIHRDLRKMDGARRTLLGEESKKVVNFTDALIDAYTFDKADINGLNKPTSQIDEGLFDKLKDIFKDGGKIDQRWDAKNTAKLRSAYQVYKANGCVTGNTDISDDMDFKTYFVINKYINMCELLLRKYKITSMNALQFFRSVGEGAYSILELLMKLRADESNNDNSADVYTID